ncbi:hypothetical protein HG530_013047 [Fusarium avenaceum]|nr:hypothetical protein HG530_013047 [Fusarium avenaceum]KIL84633.1 hypothetical protein FAVG1_12160 [Fusarium avenaceum]
MSGSKPDIIYTPLDRRRREIRLIEIISTKPTIICKLGAISLDNNPAFSAISYLWGDTGNTRKLNVNGVERAVTPSLMNALEHIPYHWKKAFPDRHFGSCRLWADALCINQEDDYEKGHQVKLMENIYAAAELVISCLDIQAQRPDIQLAFSSFESITKGAIQRGFIQQGYLEISTLENLPDPDLDWILDHPLMNEDHPWHSQEFLAAGKAMVKVMTLRYWQRAWIFQEVTLAKRLIVVHQLSSIDLDILLSAVRWIDAVKEKDIARPVKRKSSIIWQVSWRMFRSVGYIDWARQANSGFEHPSVYTGQQTITRAMIAFLGGSYGAKNPKDHVYAMIGVSGLAIDPDYTSDKSLVSVYTDVCAEFLKQEQGISAMPLFFLIGAGLALKDKEQHNELPTWVYNFTSVSRGIPANPRLFRKHDKVLEDDPCGWYESGRGASIRGNSLFAPAGFITTILETSPVLDLSPTALRRLLSSVFRMVCEPDWSTGYHHPLLNLVRALGADSLNTNVWEAPQVTRLIRVFQFILLFEQMPDDKAFEQRTVTVTEQAVLSANEILNELSENIFKQHMKRSGGAMDKNKDRLENNLQFVSRIGDWEAFQADPTHGQIQEDVKTFLKSELRVCLTASNEFVVLRRLAEKEDRVVLLKGHCRLSLVRKVASHFIYIGDCWLSRTAQHFAEKARLGEMEMELIEIR